MPELSVTSWLKTSHLVDFIRKRRHVKAMRLRSTLALLCLATILAGAETPNSGIKNRHPLFSVDISASGLMPYTWAEGSPTLPHYGIEASLGLECATPISVPLRLEVGYIRVGHSRIAPTGELYRAWDGARFALLGGYTFAPIDIRKLGKLEISALGGGALTAAEYTYTPLAYAYPSIILEARAALELGLSGKPWLALPVELMFRAGNHSIAPGLSLGWLYPFGGGK
jgi:hypothetical protein